MHDKEPIDASVEFQISDEDTSWVTEHKWRPLLSNGATYLWRYRVPGEEGLTPILLHKEIMGLSGEGPMYVEHINGDGRDNRRTNLLLLRSPLSSEKRGLRVVKDFPEHLQEGLTEEELAFIVDIGPCDFVECYWLAKNARAPFKDASFISGRAPEGFYITRVYDGGWDVINFYPDGFFRCVDPFMKFFC